MLGVNKLITNDIFFKNRSSPWLAAESFSIVGQRVLQNIPFFGIKPLKEIARFSLVFSLALLMVAPLTLLLHLVNPERSLYVIQTPHFTSAIAAFGVVLFVYTSIVASELWFLFRKHLVEISLKLKGKPNKLLA